MRHLFLVLLLANLLLLATQLGLFRDLIHGPEVARAPPVNAERLRIVRDTSSRGAPAD